MALNIKLSSVLAFAFFCPLLTFSAIKVNDDLSKPGFWGFRPDQDTTLQVTPPSFSWCPQTKSQEYELQASRSADFKSIDYTANKITFNVHCPSKTFAAGQWFWRFRFKQADKWSEWSMVRAFSIAPDARKMPLPGRDELLKRIPKSHPRLFVRPEQMSDLRKRAQTDLAAPYEAMIKQADAILKKPPATEEPPKYGSEIIRNSDEWRKIWWGNRTYVERALGSAAELGFVWQLSGKNEYGEAARRILMECAKWDPKGSTGFRYNDEAGMPYNYLFSRTYTFINALLTEEERRICREMMQIRGTEMYNNLHPRHLWQPYGSHSNRAWHFFGEIGIAFHGEIPEADTWTWFAINVFANVYPVWNDADGGWHEGMAYWSSYISRFTWWADIMKAAFDINAFDKPYFSQSGYFPMYAVPPGTHAGGFGDQTTSFGSRNCASLVAVLAAQAGNPYWSWYAEKHGIKGFGRGYIGFLRSSLPKLEPKAPSDLPQSRVFKGVGQAYFNTDLTDAANNIQLHFKSSPFGTVSHGYNSQNSFLLYVGGERLFLRSGRRDSYGTEHHKNWMWHTKSDNNITIDGEGQLRHSPIALGEIKQFETTPGFDYVVGDASQAYAKKAKKFIRRILFIKLDAIVIWDSLEAPQPSSFGWWLHTAEAMQINGQHDILATNKQGGCKVDFLYPENLKVSQTDKFDPPPRPRIKLVEHHLTAVPAQPSETQDFITLLRPFFKGQSITGQCELKKSDSGYKLAIPMKDGGLAAVYLNSKPEVPVWINGSEKKTEVAVLLLDANDKVEKEWMPRNLCEYGEKETGEK